MHKQPHPDEGLVLLISTVGHVNESRSHFWLMRVCVMKDWVNVSEMITAADVESDVQLKYDVNVFFLLAC